MSVAARRSASRAPASSATAARRLWAWSTASPMSLRDDELRRGRKQSGGEPEPHAPGMGHRQAGDAQQHSGVESDRGAPRAHRVRHEGERSIGGVGSGGDRHGTRARQPGIFVKRRAEDKVGPRAKCVTWRSGPRARRSSATAFPSPSGVRRTATAPVAPGELRVDRGLVPVADVVAFLEPCVVVPAAVSNRLDCHVVDGSA